MFIQKQNLDGLIQGVSDAVAFFLPAHGMRNQNDLVRFAKSTSTANYKSKHLVCIVMDLNSEEIRGSGNHWKYACPYYPVPITIKKTHGDARPQAVGEVRKAVKTMLRLDG